MSMKPIVKRLNISSVTILQHAVKHLSKLCDGDMDKALALVTDILKGYDIERLKVPATVGELMSDSNALQFWIHKDSSTVFMVKPKEDARLVGMAMKQSMSGFQFDIAYAYALVSRTLHITSSVLSCTSKSVLCTGLYVTYARKGSESQV